MKLFILFRANPDDFPEYASEWSNAQTSTPPHEESGTRRSTTSTPLPLPFPLEERGDGEDTEALPYRAPQKMKGKRARKASLSW
eukprot:CAMPEP_0184723980 /NCGR_PEP_ID=MMETSP0314-20130426/26674_1 /TAXON_ID=38298 /ORGANISM="Rhodella maculata, Strain CCMP 736" /LENGTH=83 /DNA_ID=CAMNT_0027188889 /DNA_START=27 /DNA_END=275 /DNA_ORIENTATION=+